MLSHYRINVALLLFQILIAPTVRSSTFFQQKIDASVSNDLITLSVTVRNRDGQNLPGLTREAFEVIDEKQARPLAFFENTEELVSIGILVDTSESMKILDPRDANRAKPIIDAVPDLIHLGNANNEYFLIAFDKTPRFLTDWQGAAELLAQKMDIVAAGRDTALFDASFAALEKLGTARHARRALVLISDGQDNVSRQKLPESAKSSLRF